MNEKRQILKDAAIKIVEDRITEIGSKEELLISNPKAYVVGSKNFMLIPGLVNSHQHLTGDRLIQSCIPSSIEDTEAIFDWSVPIHSSHSPEDDEISATLSLAESARFGITFTVEAGTVAFPEMVLRGFETVGVGQVELDVIESVDSVIVVLVPESGDDIQIMKAGLIEIADLYVINKSDREDADKLFIILSNMLQLVNNKNWIPEIIKTVAIENIGISDLCLGLDKHKDYLYDSNQLNNKSRLRYVRKIKNKLINDFEHSFWTTERINFLDKKISESKIYDLDINNLIKDLQKI